MDPVTKHVMRLLDDTMAAPEAKSERFGHVQDTLLTSVKDHPIGDVSGRVKGPSGKDNVGGDAQKGPPDAKPAVAPGMDSEDFLRGSPNAMGRMARMKQGSY